MPDLALHNIPKVGPISYVDILDETAMALEAMGQQNDASPLRLQAKTIRLEHPNQKSITDRTPYGKFCD
ncbi:hypothetical protein LG202_00450 [Methylobacillus methanolivorans]